MRKPLTAAILGITLTGCATYEPVPQGYAGPTATVVDTGFSEDGTKAQLPVHSIDGTNNGGSCLGFLSKQVPPWLDPHVTR